MLRNVHFQKYRSITITGQVQERGGGRGVSYHYPAEKSSKIWVFSTVEDNCVIHCIEIYPPFKWPWPFLQSIRIVMPVRAERKTFVVNGDLRL